MERIDCAVVGAGVVGLAVARSLARRGREVVVLEAADAIGTGISSRNSEVVHAGIYYARGSLKARLCVEGCEQLYAYCAERGVAHRRCGKLIVATGASQHAALERLAAQARANGVADLQWLDGGQARALEPALACREALLSPSTGIVDGHGLMLALLGEAGDHGALLALKSPLRRARVTAGGLELDIGGAEPMRVRARCVVNAAGLDAPRVAASIEGLAAARVPRVWPCKGNYFRCAGRAAFSRLVYPLPEEAGLGVHLTLDLAGQMRFGPDVQWIERIDDLAVDASRADMFHAAIRRWWPQLPDGALAPDYAGIRPKIAGPGEPARDFLIEGPQAHGVAGLVNLFGIESPGLTASLAIGEHVAALLQQ